MTSALLRHVWGKSAAVDRVWAQVTGLRPSVADDRLLMVLQAFLDESFSAPGKGDTFVMAGHIATAEQWAAFSAEWEKLLSWGTRGSNGKMRFKLSEMGMGDEAKERIQAFWRVIETHAPVSISVAFRPSELENAKRRISIPGIKINWDGLVGSPYALAFTGIMESVWSGQKEYPALNPHGEKIDFIFDNRSEKAKLLAAWDGYLASAPPSLAALVGTLPRFEDEEDFLPLQAADLFAGLLRRSSDNGTQFLPPMVAKKNRFSFNATYSEDQLVQTFAASFRNQRPDFVVHDIASGVPRPVRL